LVCVSFAQDTNPPDPNQPSPNESVEDEETPVEEGQYLVVNELGFGVGYPTYQLYHVYYSFQRDVFGVAFRGSYTASNGIYLGVAGRYYTPIPAPVPTFVSLGLGFSGTGANVAATFGAHVPFGLDSPARATLEAGLGYEGGENAGLRFVASLGVGYVFFVDAAPISEEERQRRELAGLDNCRPEQVTEPDPEKLEVAFDIALEDFLDKARAQYAGQYSALRYDIDILSQEVNGVEATIEARFSGSVKVNATGNREGARGTITARFGWTGCSWKLLDYDADTGRGDD
jgi:hypothetical protein